MLISVHAGTLASSKIKQGLVIWSTIVELEVYVDADDVIRNWHIFILLTC
jgi:hypothetical protein